MQNQLPEENNPTALLLNGCGESVWESLEPKKQIAAIEYAVKGTYTAAAKKVGSTPATIRKWAKDMRFAALVKHQMELLQQESLVSALMLERMALDVFEVAMGEEVTHAVDKDGDGYSAPITNLPAANQAIATIHRIKSDQERIKVEKDKNKNGQQVIVNIENANFNSNQHFDMLKRKQGVDVDTGEGRVIEHE